MIHYYRTKTINAAPEAIWNVLGDFMRIDEFAPLITSVDALTEGENGLGSKRKCNFKDGNFMVEEVIDWQPNKSYRVRLSEIDPMPLHEGTAEIAIKLLGENQSEVKWSMDYRVKYGPLGWLLGQTLMKKMMGGVLDKNLNGLSDKVLAN